MLGSLQRWFYLLYLVQNRVLLQSGSCAAWVGFNFIHPPTVWMCRSKHRLCLVIFCQVSKVLEEWTLGNKVCRAPCDVSSIIFHLPESVCQKPCFMAPPVCVVHVPTSSPAVRAMFADFRLRTRFQSTKQSTRAWRRRAMASARKQRLEFIG